MLSGDNCTPWRGHYKTITLFVGSRFGGSRMLTLPECKMTFVCGPVASGKTFTIKDFIKNDNRHCVFDSTGEYMDDGAHEEIWANPRALYERVKANPYYFRIVYVPGRSRQEDFSHVLNALWWLDTPKLLVCDEVADICPVSSLDGDVERILRFARKDKMGFLTASQRIADVHKLFTGGCRMVVLFQTHEIRDLDAIESRWGCGKMVEQLRPLLYDDSTETVRQIPQCLVIEKGQKPYVYDFQAQSKAGSESEQETAEPSPSPGVEDDSSEAL